ncbi:MAG: aldehyde dehydrogenase family protein [Actinomycetales bacterium]|nr:aldehyde dehydrogenase family protein [Actinomycetales bacterium]
MSEGQVPGQLAPGWVDPGQMAQAWVDPRTGSSQQPPMADSDSSEVADAVAAAHTAWLAWRSLSHEHRAMALSAIADALDDDAGPLAALGDAETALGVPRLTGEVARTTFQLRMFGSALRAGAILGQQVDDAVAGPPPAGRPHLVRTRLPLGVVAVFGASNFPLAFGVLGGDTASALAAGCAVVVKEHPAHPRLSAHLVALARSALVRVGAPADVLTSVRGIAAGAALVAAEQVRAVGFTGSTAGGRALFDLAMSRPDPIPFYGELGSVNPVIVTPAAAAARGEEIGTGFVESLTLGAGQFCTKPALLGYPRPSTSLVAAAIAALTAVPAVPLLTPAIAERFTRRVAQLAEVGTLLAGGGAVDQPGAWVRPALVGMSAETYLNGPALVREECFGPAALLVSCSDADQALALASSGPGVLVSCLHTVDDDAVAPGLAAALAYRSGRVVINGWPTGVAVSPVQMHGGPYPASTRAQDTSVGLAAVDRFTRPVVWQSAPASLILT